jgi:hypothetical protein
MSFGFDGESFFAYGLLRSIDGAKYHADYNCGKPPSQPLMVSKESHRYNFTSASHRNRTRQYFSRAILRMISIGTAGGAAKVRPRSWVVAEAAAVVEYRKFEDEGTVTLRPDQHQRRSCRGSPQS